MDLRFEGAVYISPSGHKFMKPQSTLSAGIGGYSAGLLIAMYCFKSQTDGWGPEGGTDHDKKPL